ncbi:hypothetical protein [Microcystis aeruginosa]|uniref:Uncharacterized protein n=1 Tax=Microcystis aeruginosa PCC 9808 TaxID=1160284 RepID=I4HWZ8_MICAE|nr:hypothetical protein [Microcystis aeruginosa]MDB9411190.1 hypothetical protein [Microcystis aeruginosa CS-567/02]MDB9427777.1 hypothetical protein [Microcystis aeruginosa CS-555/01A07]CCI26572.1 hypothetical protein MICAG_3140004 [Microcystis aeruginosa PCC 9808]
MNEAQKAVLEIVESVYTDGGDARGKPELSEDEKFIFVQFQDGEKLLEAKISDRKQLTKIAAMFFSIRVSSLINLSVA